MMINVINPVLQTIIFSVLFFIAVLITIRKSHKESSLGTSFTNELKGLAILMVIFSHTGYFLAIDTKFLFPLSIFAGVGVDLFLFLSGFGLTTSALKNTLSPLSFYKKRLFNIFLPMWLVISILYLLSFFILNKSYPFNEIIYSYLGYFPVADIYTSLNSPLWYFSFILFFYLIFPFVFWKKTPLLSVFVITILGIFTSSYKLPVTVDIQRLYQLHIFAFPIGMLFGIFADDFKDFDIHKVLNKIKLSEKIKNRVLAVLKVIGIVLFSYLFGYTAINSGVGKAVMTEQFYSLITMASLVIVAILKRFQSRFLILIGIYSYEIYLIQWPLMYHYDFLYKLLPASLATFVYIFILIFLGYALNSITKLIKSKLF